MDWTGTLLVVLLRQNWTHLDSLQSTVCSLHNPNALNPKLYYSILYTTIIFNTVLITHNVLYSVYCIVNCICSNVLTTGSRNHVEDVGCVSIEHSEVFEVVSSLDHQDDVDTNDKVEGAQEGLVVLPVAQVEVMGQFLRDCLVPGLGCRGLRRNQPTTWRYFPV